MIFGPSYYVNVQGLTLAPSVKSVDAVEEYITHRTGFLTSPGVDWIDWEKLPDAYRSNFTNSTSTDLAKFPQDWPEVEYDISEATLSVAERVFGTIIAIPVSPTSKGTVTIISNDTSDLPVIDPRWLTSETDIQVAVQAFKRTRAMLATSAIQPVLLGDEISLGQNVTTDEDIYEWIKNNS